MTLRELGYVVIINNLRSQIPKAFEDVQALRTALELVGFNVKCYNDCDVQVSVIGSMIDFLEEISPLLGGRWQPCFRHQVTSVLSFKVRMHPPLPCFIVCL